MTRKNDDIASDPLSFYARRDADRDAAYAFDQERIAEADALITDPEPVAVQCPKCGVYVWTYDNLASHICVEYRDRPCVTCGKPTTFVMIAAPGYGQGYSCPDGHYDGSQGMLTPEDVR